MRFRTQVYLAISTSVALVALCALISHYFGPGYKVAQMIIFPGLLVDYILHGNGHGPVGATGEVTMLGSDIVIYFLTFLLIFGLLNQGKKDSA